MPHDGGAALAAVGLVAPLSALAVWFIAHRTLMRMEGAAPRPARVRASFALLVVLAAWLGAATALSVAGVFEAASVLVPVFAFVPPLLGMRLVARSPLLTALVDRFPQPWLVGVQAFRLLGVLFLLYYAEGAMPAAFAIPSGVGDIVVGAAALPLAALAARPTAARRTLLRSWNYFGVVDLVVAVTMGALTAPTLVQVLSFDAPNHLIISHPLVVVPTFAVPFGLLLHLVSLRGLRSGTGWASS